MANLWYHKFVRTQVFHHAHSYSYEVETLPSFRYIRTTGSGFTSQRECRRHLQSDVRYILEKLDVMKRSPRMKRTTIDEHAVRELDLYAENTSELYPQKKAILANLERKKKSGKYDPSKAPKLWMYWVDNAARRYVKEFGGEVRTVFPKPEREHLATELARSWERGEME